MTLNLNPVDRKTAFFRFSVVNLHTEKLRVIVTPHNFRHLGTFAIRQSLQRLLMDNEGS